MKFGLFNLMSLWDNPDGIKGVLSDTEEMVKLAEDLGFDAAWFAEHHFTNNSISTSPMMVASYMARVTTRIRLGAAVLVLPLYHPMRLAQEIAFVDQASNGRVVLGIGPGFQPFEFARYGVDLDTRSDHFMECWSIIEQALSRGFVEFKGTYFDIPPTRLMMRPYHSAMPEVFVASSNPSILRQLVPSGAKPFVQVGWQGSKALAEKVVSLREAWQEAGLGGQHMPVAVQQYIHVTDSASEALEAAERARFVARMVNTLRKPNIEFDGFRVKVDPLTDEPPLETFRDNLIIGDAHYVAERLSQELLELRPDYYNCFFQFGDLPISRARRSLERFGSQVLPLVEKAVGPLNAFGSMSGVSSTARATVRATPGY